MLIGWNRGKLDDVVQSLDLGFRAIHIGLPASDVHLKHSVGRDRGWLVEQARTLIGVAKDRGAFVSISAEDVGRTDPSFLIDYAGAVKDAGADRLRLSDTIGILSPSRYAAVVASIAKAVPIDLQCHAHNDYGLATANTLAGLEAGLAISMPRSMRSANAPEWPTLPRLPCACATFTAWIWVWTSPSSRL